MFTVRVAVAAPVPGTAKNAGTEQVGVATVFGAFELIPTTLQESVRLPVKPPVAVTVMVEVPLPPGEMLLMLEVLTAKPGLIDIGIVVEGLPL